VQLSVTDTTSRRTAALSDRCHQNGPLAGICPYVATSTSCVDVGPVPLVVSPSLPAAVDLSVSYADDLPLNLSVSTTTGAVRHLLQTVSDSSVQSESFQHDGQQFDAAGHLETVVAVNQPPPAHCHVTGRGVLDSKLSTDALSRLHRQWTVSAHENDPTDTSTAGTSSAAGDTLRSLDVLSAAAVLTSQILDGRLVLASAAETVTSASVNSCLVSQLMMMVGVTICCSGCSGRWSSAAEDPKQPQHCSGGLNSNETAPAVKML